MRKIEENGERADDGQLRLGFQEFAVLTTPIEVVALAEG